MCGIVGIAGNTYGKHSKMFRDMLVFDTVRGFDSTGIAVVGPATGGAEVEKAVGGPDNLWASGTSKLLNNRGILKNLKKVMIGHNRAATVGEVTEDNAHPFVYSHITGVHNGSLTDWYDLEGWRENPVDSMSIFQTIAEKGIDHCWKNFHGAAALVFWDDKDETLNLIRNSERPLWVAHSDKNDVLFWASELWMIKVAASRASVELKTIKNADGEEVLDTYQLKANFLHTYSPKANSCELKEVRELEKKSWYQRPAPVQSSQTANYGKTTPTGAIHTPLAKKSYNGINTTWAAGLDKAEKGVVGLEFKLTGIMSSVVQGQAVYNMIGRTIDHQMVLLYPSTTTERDEWEDRCKAISNGELWFKMKHRPRITNTGWAISTRGVEVVKPAKSKTPKNVTVLYPKAGASVTGPESWSVGKVVDRMCAGFSGKATEDLSMLYQAHKGRVTKRRWLELMEKTKFKGDCAACSDPLQVEDHKEIMWIDDQWVLCQSCASIEETVALLQSGYMS